MTAAVLACLVLLLSISKVHLQKLQLRSYDKSVAQDTFEKKNGIVYERWPVGAVLRFDETEKEAQILLIYYRAWQDTTLPVFKGYLINDKTLWQPAQPYEKDQYTTYVDRMFIRKDKWVFNVKFLLMTLPCHRLSNYRYPKDRFQCFALHNTWEPPRHQYTCLNLTGSFFRNGTIEATTICERKLTAVILNRLHVRYFKTDWKLVAMRPFPGNKNRRGPKALEVDLERHHPHFLIAEALAAVGIGALVLCQSLLPPEMGQRLLTGGFGVLIALAYWANLQALPVVRIGFEPRLAWLGLGLLLLQAWALVLSVLCWNLCQRQDQAPLWLRSLPLLGTNSLSEEPCSQWRDAVTVIGRLSFVLELAAFVILICTIVPV